MGYVTDDGRHEGYLVPVFNDGVRGTGTTGGGIPDDQVICGALAYAEDGAWTSPARPASEVTGWVVCCDCTIGASFQHTTWVGSSFTRVRSPELGDIGARRLFAPDDDVAYVGDRFAVEEAVINLWRCEHAGSQESMAEVAAEALTQTQARQRLDAAVAAARWDGVSWADIGRAASISSRSARDRWHGVERPPS